MDEIALLKQYYPDGIHGEELTKLTDFMEATYIRMVDELGRYIEPHSKVLDWGAGDGQLSLLLKSRGYDVTAYDIIPKSEAYDKIGVTYIKGGDTLPFQSDSFDAVVSCGVLEHVNSDVYSLSELYRILKPDGYLFIFNLPNKYSLSEFIGRHTKLGGHKHIYIKKEIANKLSATKFNVLSLHHSHMLPHHPSRLKAGWLDWLYNQHNTFTSNVDKLLEAIPGINFFSNEWLAIAGKDPTSKPPEQESWIWQHPIAILSSLVVLLLIMSSMLNRVDIKNVDWNATATCVRLDPNLPFLYNSTLSTANISTTFNNSSPHSTLHYYIQRCLVYKQK